jgi:hypothetical protein
VVRNIGRRDPSFWDVTWLLQEEALDVQRETGLIQMLAARTNQSVIGVIGLKGRRRLVVVGNTSSSQQWNSH